MNPAWIVRLRPAGPWRIGPASGARDRVDRILHSDTLFSAVTIAMIEAGMGPEWLDATVHAPEPAVRFSSVLPFLSDMLFAPPPQTHWPPPVSTRVRWKGVRFAPLQAIARLLAEEPMNEDSWFVDGESGCLLPSGRGKGQGGPFRISVRRAAAIDRVSGAAAAPHTSACLEFAPRAGMWFGVAFANEAARDAWSKPLRGVLRLLADSGLGGERSRGWGRSEDPEITEGRAPDMLVPGAAEPPNSDAGAWWLLSLFTPAEQDQVDWARGSYSMIVRGGRVESRSAWGAEKRLTRMVAEGSVLLAGHAPKGTTQDVSPAGLPHPVYRCGTAFAVPIPARAAS